HRHAASARRSVLESGDGAYTAVDGERTTMHAGDFILTPSWTYHDHGNPGDQPAIWLDGLDIPLVNLFSASFAEHHPEEVQPVLRPEGDAMSRYGAGLMPVDFTPERRSPMLSYPYARSREALDRLQRNGPVDPVHGVTMQYVNPATGGYPMPTIAAFLQLLPRGFETRSYRSTDATIFCAAEGRGTSRVGDQRFTWGPRDVFVVPSWAPVSHDADEEAVLFSFSDRPAQKSLGLWREQREETADGEAMGTLTMTRPSKAAQGGSRLRPANLLEARERRRRGEITAADLRRIEDAAIRDVVAMQERIGMPSITDGEFRRGLWHMDFVCDFANVQQAPGIPIKFHSDEGEIEWAPPGVKITGKLARPHPIFVEDF